jgi:hypothetical protein
MENMGFTNIDLVKKHVLEHELGTAGQENLACRLVGETPFQLPHVLLLAGSEKVKAKENTVPIGETIAFSSSESVRLTYGELIPDTVVVASDSSLGHIYAENADYAVDYEKGIITRLPQGGIASGSSVVVWYLCFRLYTKDGDYRMYYAKGQIERISGGDIQDGQWVLVDYSVELGLLSDEVVENAVNEAGHQVAAYIDSSHANSADPSLVTAETYLAVSILCNVKAMETMTQNASAGSSSQIHSLSQAWSNMSSRYRQLAYGMLEKFKKDPGGFSSPRATKSRG